MKLSEFDYHLPSEFIAQYPLSPRDSSRLMVIERRSGKIIHQRFRDLPALLKPSDLLLLNNTRVFLARLSGKDSRGKDLETLLLKEIEKDLWEVLLRGLKRLKLGDRINFPGEVTGELISKNGEGKGIIRFYCPGKFKAYLANYGTVPLPPYIRRDSAGLEKVKRDRESYQTVYAKYKGAIAAPTAGLHFTRRLLKEIKEKGVEVLYLTLHIGYATFKPVRTEFVEDHHLEKEAYKISLRTAQKIISARRTKRRIIAVGTSTVRTIESAFRNYPEAKLQGETDLFIFPKYNFKLTDRLLTNFHLPHSTPLLLTAAFSGQELILKAYREAVRKRYRFYSYGDAMLII